MSITIVRFETGRRIGVVVGLAVAAGAVAVAAPIFVGFLHLSAVDFSFGLAVPTIATGILVGRLFGRSAWSAKSADDAGVLGLRIAAVATAFGAYLVGVAMGATRNDNLVASVIQTALSGLILWPFGILIFGLLALPITFAAGLVWARTMMWLARRAQVPST